MTAWLCFHVGMVPLQTEAPVLVSTTFSMHVWQQISFSFALTHRLGRADSHPRHKTGLIHRSVRLPWMGAQPFWSCGQPKMLCLELLCLLAEVNKPWWCGQSEAPMSAP